MARMAAGRAALGGRISALSAMAALLPQTGMASAECVAGDRGGR